MRKVIHTVIFQCLEDDLPTHIFKHFWNQDSVFFCLFVFQMVIFHLLSMKLSLYVNLVIAGQCFKFLILIMFIVGPNHCLQYFQNIYIMIQLWNEAIMCTEAWNRAMKWDLMSVKQMFVLADWRQPHGYKGLYGSGRHPCEAGTGLWVLLKI